MCHVFTKSGQALLPLNKFSMYFKTSVDIIISIECPFNLTCLVSHRIHISHVSHYTVSLIDTSPFDLFLKSNDFNNTLVQLRRMPPGSRFLNFISCCFKKNMNRLF
jgi:hypothetical protein